MVTDKEIAAITANPDSTIMIIMVTTLCALLLLAALVLAWKVLGIKRVSKGEIIAEEKKKEEAEIKKDAELIRLQNRVLKDIVQQIDKIEYKDIMAEQMRVVDKAIEKAILKMREIHLALVIEKVGDEAANRHPSIRSYENITKIVAYRYADRFRTYMRENGFNEMSEMEFQNYIQTKLAELFAYTAEIIDHGYKHDIIGVEELRNKQKDNILVYGQMLSQVFVEAREIKRKAVVKIDALQKKYAKIQRHYIQTGEILDLDGCDAEQDVD